MKILFDDAMPYADDFFAGLGDCHAFSHSALTSADLTDVEVLFVRSTTRINEELLSQARQLKLVGTATAGTNHVDKDYLTSREIPFVSAAGCNAIAVAEYVISALFVMAKRLGWQLHTKQVGIVGAGHVGSTLAKKLDALAINYLLCDPPLEAKGDARQFVSLDQIMHCDFISLHVPLIDTGEYPTRSMFDAERLAQLTEQQVLINACRGEVLDNQAALDAFNRDRKLHLVMDVWENEPDIPFALVEFTQLATPHIAGHTLEGKARGTEMLYQHLCGHLNQPVQKKLSDFLPQAKALKLPQVHAADGASKQIIEQAVMDVYNIEEDDRRFRTQVTDAGGFVQARKHYAVRREFSEVPIQTPINTGNLAELQALYGLGFQQAKTI